MKIQISITLTEKSIDLLNEIQTLEHKLLGVSSGRSANINKCVIYSAEKIINEIKNEISTNKPKNKNN
jgi:hypothetical protein